MKPSDPRPYVCLDIETGGLDPDAHEILGISAMRLSYGTLEMEASYSALIMPEAPQRVTPEAARINGFCVNKWALRGAVPIQEALRQLWRLFGGLHRCDMVAHNAAFDAEFLEVAYARLKSKDGTPTPAPWALRLCTLQACKLLGLRDLSLRGCCRAFGVRFDPRSAHCAEYDAARVADLLRALHRHDARRPLTDRAHADSPGVCEHCGAALVWRRRVPLDASTLTPHRLTCPDAHRWSRLARVAQAES
jgi:ribonuclease T